MTTKATQWIDAAYVKWRGARRRASQKDWAEEIGVPFNTAKNWLNRDQIPDAEGCLLLALHTGDWTIFELAGHPMPDAGLVDLARVWGRLSEKAREDIFTRALRAAGTRK